MKILIVVLVLGLIGFACYQLYDFIKILRERSRKKAAANEIATDTKDSKISEKE